MIKCVKRVVLYIFILVPWFVFAGQDNFALSGQGILRFRYIQANQDEISGTYGEVLKQGLSMRQRFDISGNFFLTEYLTIGGTARISNENSRDV